LLASSCPFPFFSCHMRVAIAVLFRLSLLHEMLRLFFFFHGDSFVLRTFSSRGDRSPVSTLSCLYFGFRSMWQRPSRPQDLFFFTPGVPPMSPFLFPVCVSLGVLPVWCSSLTLSSSSPGLFSFCRSLNLLPWGLSERFSPESRGSLGPSLFRVLVLTSLTT